MCETIDRGSAKANPLQGRLGLIIRAIPGETLPWKAVRVGAEDEKNNNSKHRLHLMREASQPVDKTPRKTTRKTTRRVKTRGRLFWRGNSSLMPFFNSGGSPAGLIIE
jgi:hypothetical protein